MVRALLAAVAILEDLVKVGPDSHMALSALKEIGFELSEMESEKTRRFFEALERVAAAERDRAAWIRDVPSAPGIDV